LFCIASNSKLFTALAIGLLVQNGTKLSNGAELSWSSKLKDVLPEWALMDEYASEHVDITDLGSRSPSRCLLADE
jgi:CubicO group peptidase (beta-lactamase class C family)